MARRRRRARRGRPASWVVVVAAVSLTAACSSSPAPGSIGTASPIPATPTVAPSAAAAAAASTAAIIGFGAVDSVWEAHHRADPDFAPGSVYDADPALPQINGHTGAHYVAVMHQNGRVLGYTLNFPSHTGIAEAKTAAVAELPADAQLVWFQTLGTCAQEQLRSATLGHALGGDDPQGGVFVEFDSDAATNGNPSYSPNNVTEAIFLAGWNPTVADAPSC